MLRRLASWCHRHRRIVVLLWLIALVGITLLGNVVGANYGQGSEIKGTESQQASALLQARFTAHAGDEGQIVFTDPRGVTDPAVQARMEPLFDEARGAARRARDRQPVHRRGHRPDGEGRQGRVRDHPVRAEGARDPEVDHRRREVDHEAGGG